MFIGRAHCRLKYMSRMRCGSDGVLIARSTGVACSMNVWSNDGNPVNSWDRCHASSDAVAFDLNNPVAYDLAYLYSDQRS